MNFKRMELLSRNLFVNNQAKATNQANLNSNLTYKSDKNFSICYLL